MIRQKSGCQHQLIPNSGQIEYQIAVKTYFFWLAIEYGDKILSNFDEDLLFFLVFNRIQGQYLSLKQNFRWISAAFRMPFVKTMKASPRANFYGLSTKYTPLPQSTWLTKHRIRKIPRIRISETVFCTEIDSKKEMI